MLRSLPCLAVLLVLGIQSAPQPLVPKVASATPQSGMTTLIESLPFIIDRPGEYVLASDVTAAPHPQKPLTFGIKIVAHDVRLDLAGHVLGGALGTETAILIQPPERVDVLVDLSIRNGTIRNWGGWAIDAFRARHVLIEDLTIATNGLPRTPAGGIRSGAATRIDRCVVQLNAGTGVIVSTGSRLDDLLVGANTGQGILMGAYSLASNCVVEGNGSDGLVLSGLGGSVSATTVAGNDGYGIVAGTGSAVRDCSVVGNVLGGVDAGSSSLVSGCLISQNGGTGLRADSTGCRIEGNHVDGGRFGIVSRGRANVIVSNTVSGSSVGLTIGGGNVAGPTFDGAGMAIDALTIAGLATGADAADDVELPVGPPPWANIVIR